MKFDGEMALDDLLDVEAGLVAGVLVEPFGVLDQVGRPARGDEIGLLEEIEEGVAAPFRVLEALVAAFGLDGIVGASASALTRWMALAQTFM